ncbi:hypothetical protein AB0B28_11930 [Glycomyces sp. NPDC046736]|uniref:hypothetical protein n=1 Tax=Glycomyces sp. NPDC046736 TaxID=3155615 RepID=UPI0033F916A9
MADASNGTHDGAQLLGLVWRLVRDEGFDPADFVLAGSARLMATGFRRRLSDIDIVARGETWSRARELARVGRGYTERTAVSGARVVRLFEGLVEVCDHWFMPGLESDSIIDRAERIDGLPYMTLADLKAYKQKLDRPKDRRDLAVIARSEGAQRQLPLTPVLLSADREKALASV